MADVVTLAALIGAAVGSIAQNPIAQNIFANRVDEVLKKLGVAVKDRIAGEDGSLPRNHDVEIAIRLAHVQALRATTAEFLEANPASEENQNFARRMLDWLDQQASLTKVDADWPSTEILVQNIDAAVAGNARNARHDSLRESAEQLAWGELELWTRAEAFTTAPEAFHSCFFGKHGARGWYPAFGAFVADAMKSNARFSTVFVANHLVHLSSAIDEIANKGAEHARLLRNQTDTILSALLDIKQDIRSLRSDVAQVHSSFVSLPDQVASALAQMRDTRESLSEMASGMLDIRNEIIKPLETVSGFSELSTEHVRRLPTALLVADYGVVRPYDDGRGLKADLLQWAIKDARGPAGRLYAAAGGFGKTRLALEVIATLRDEYGWRTGLLPRGALERTDAHGIQDADARLKRFFDIRTESGALLVLDYAESRLPDVDRVAAAALSSKGSQIRIVLLSRSAGEWWHGLQRESRAVQLIFDASPIAAMGGEIPKEERSALFRVAAQAFAERLKAAQTDDDPLLDPNWDAISPPSGRLTSDAVSSPLAIAFEAFLHVRGVNPKGSPLAEMAREERRHWARAVGLKVGDMSRMNDVRITALQRCAASLTLMQGHSKTDARSIDRTLDGVLNGALQRLSIGRNDLARAKAYAEIRSALHQLYRFQEGSAHALRPVLPDLLGEHIVGEALLSDNALLGDFLAANDDAKIMAFRVLNRVTRADAAGKPLHEKPLADAIIQSTESAIENPRAFQRYIDPLIGAANLEPGDIQRAALNALRTQPDELKGAQAVTVIEAHDANSFSMGVALRLRPLLAEAALLADDGSVERLHEIGISWGSDANEMNEKRILHYHRSARALHLSGDYARALKLLTAAMPIAEALYRSAPTQYWRILGQQAFNLAVAQRVYGHSSQAKQNLQRAIDLAREGPGSDGTALLATAVTTYCDWYAQSEPIDQLLDYIAESERLWNEGAGLNENANTRQEARINLLSTRAKILSRAQKHNEAISVSKEATQGARSLFEEFSDEYTAFYVSVLSRHADRLIDAKDFHGACSTLEKAINAVRHNLDSLSPTESDVVMNCGSAYLRAQIELGLSHEEAAQKLEEATFLRVTPMSADGTLDELEERTTHRWKDNPNELASHLYPLFETRIRDFLAKKQPDAALAICRKARDYLNAPDASDDRTDGRLAEISWLASVALSQLGQDTECVEALATAAHCILRQSNPEKFLERAGLLVDVEIALRLTYYGQQPDDQLGYQKATKILNGMPAIMHIYNRFVECHNSGDDKRAQACIDLLRKLNGEPQHADDPAMKWVLNSLREQTADADPTDWPYGPLPMA